MRGGHGVGRKALHPSLTLAKTACPPYEQLSPSAAERPASMTRARNGEEAGYSGSGGIRAWAFGARLFDRLLQRQEPRPALSSLEDGRGDRARRLERLFRHPRLSDHRQARHAHADHGPGARPGPDGPGRDADRGLHAGGVRGLARGCARPAAAWLAGPVQRDLPRAGSSPVAGARHGDRLAGAASLPERRSSAQLPGQQLPVRQRAGEAGQGFEDRLEAAAQHPPRRHGRARRHHLGAGAPLPARGTGGLSPPETLVLRGHGARDRPGRNRPRRALGPGGAQGQPGPALDHLQARDRGRGVGSHSTSTRPSPFRPPGPSASPDSPPATFWSRCATSTCWW